MGKDLELTKEEIMQINFEYTLLINYIAAADIINFCLKLITAHNYDSATRAFFNAVVQSSSINASVFQQHETLFSAGAGRTGTYIAIDNLTEEISETGKVDVINAVMKMRRNRKDMIQTAVNNDYDKRDSTLTEKMKVFFLKSISCKLARKLVIMLAM